MSIRVTDRDTTIITVTSTHSIMTRSTTITGNGIIYVIRGTDHTHSTAITDTRIITVSGVVVAFISDIRLSSIMTTTTTGRALPAPAVRVEAVSAGV